MNLSCKDAARLLSEKRDRRLPWRARISLRVHMLACKMCQVYGAQLAVVGRVCREAGAHGDEKSPEALPDELKQRMRETIRRPR